MSPQPAPPPLPPGIRPGMASNGSMARRKIGFESEEMHQARPGDYMLPDLTPRDEAKTAPREGALHDGDEGDSAFGYLRFDRMDAVEPQAMMGSTWRNRVTGAIHVKGEHDYPNFTVVDFWTRKHVAGSIPQLLQDKYLFRPLPMAYRSWMYHEIILKRMFIDGALETGMVQHVLNQRCVDVGVNAGRWSPLMFYAPMLLAACITGDMTVMLAGVVLSLLLCLISSTMNNPYQYRYARPISFPFRLGFVVLVFLQMMAAQEGATYPGYLLTLALLLAEVFYGDMKALVAFRLECRYEIIRVLPNRVFICRRIGASHLEETFGTRGNVDGCISAFASWERTFTLIADISGMLVELRPMREQDWKEVYEEFCQTFIPLPFAALDVYDESRPTANGKKRKSVNIFSPRASPKPSSRGSLANTPKDRGSPHSR